MSKSEILHLRVTGKARDTLNEIAKFLDKKPMTLSGEIIESKMKILRRSEAGSLKGEDLLEALEKTLAKETCAPGIVSI